MYIIGIIFLIASVIAAPWLCQRYSEAKPWKFVVGLASFAAILCIALDPIYRKFGDERKVGLALVLGILIIIIIEGCVIKVYQIIYGSGHKAGYKEAENDYQSDLDRLSQENARLLQFLEEQGIELPSDWDNNELVFIIARN